MTIAQRTGAFAKLGAFLNRHYAGRQIPEETQLHKGLEALIPVVQQHNPWFTPESVNGALQNIASMLEPSGLENFTKDLKDSEARQVAVICAGNIPLVCFHDVLCVLLSGHRILIKMSADDNLLLPFFLKLLVHYEPEFEHAIRFADGKLSGFEAVIATGSNNTAKHFEYYFRSYPHIIRRNRTSVAVIRGDESEAELRELGKDIFMYFGLGCRNVGKILVPQEYDFGLLFQSLHVYGNVIQHNKYANNYEYHRSLYLLESIPFLDNNFLILRESTELHSPVSVLFYQRFKDEVEVNAYLNTNRDQIQCIVGREFTPFGCSQRPVITEFADKVDTMEFLVHL
ncbi:MAG TPA: acyl-CoA reductase [Bacteroidia bacterium]|nr:acyl-CoA reductase [Bacteroidia bacterium]